MKRVLALHGHSQSAHIFSRKVDWLRKACEGNIEFVFVDAPHVLHPVDIPGSLNVPSVFYDHRITPRAWWKDLYGMHDTWAVIESINYLRDILETEGPFIGVLGFSQGAALAAMLAGYLDHPGFSPYFSKVNHPPFQFCVLASGFLTPDPVFHPPKRIKTPILHIIGHNDTLVLTEWSRNLSANFIDSRVEVHEGGHFIPRKPIWRQFLIKYFMSWGEHRTPMIKPLSLPPSPSPPRFLPLDEPESPLFASTSELPLTHSHADWMFQVNFL